MDRARLAQLAMRAKERPLNLWRPLPHQDPPEGDWLRWWLVKGRGAGGTSATVRWAWNHCHGPACDNRFPGGHRGILIGPSVADVSSAMVYGPAGFSSIDPKTKIISRQEGQMVVLPNKVRLRLISGGNERSVQGLRSSAGVCFVAIDEASIIPHLELAVELAEGSLRIGPNPRLVASTTPAPRPALREIVEGPDTVRTHAKSTDNPHLHPRFLERMSGMVGTELGRQELDGEWVEQRHGPLWSKGPKVAPLPAHMAYTVVVVDPAGSAGESADETGVVVVGVDLENCLWVIDDLSNRLTPEEATDRVWAAATRYRADMVIYESNGGKDWIRTTLLSHPQAREDRLAEVWQEDSKVDRFEPVARLYWDGPTVHARHARSLPELEGEMLSWRPGDRSPNRLDAMATGLTWLVVHRVGPDHYRGLFDGGRPKEMNNGDR